jgi:hypothetical protein
MFYGLAYLSFFMISFSWIPIVIDVFSDRLLPFSKLPEYQCCIRFRQYRIDFNFEKKKCKNESDLASYRSFPIVFIPTSLLLNYDGKSNIRII